MAYMRSLSQVSYNGIPLGLELQGSIACDTTYRVRTGNGHANSKRGVKYQDKFAYTIPGNISNEEGEPYRDLMREACYHWKYTLTPDEKQLWIDESKTLKGVHGLNLFCRDWINTYK
jgi:hypothetical protein